MSEQNNEETENNTMGTKHKSTAKVSIQVMISCLGALYFGYALGELNMAQPKLNLVYDISKDDEEVYQGILNSAVPLGAAFGCIVAGIILKSMGRRTIFIIADIVGIAGCLLFLIANFWVATVARFIMGFLVGVNSTVVPLYIREISPVSISGMTGVFNQGNINFGIVLGYIFGLGFPINEQDLEDQSGFFWRLVLLFPIFPLTVRLLSFLFVYKKDTASFYLTMDQADEAREVIQETYLEEFQDEIFKTIESEAITKTKQVDSWGLVFSSKYGSRLILGCMMQVFQQFGGINAIVFYSNDIFNDALGSKELANVMTVVSGLVLMVFAFASGVFSKRYGRKIILLTGQLFLAVVLIGTGIVSYLTKDDENLSTGLSVLIIGLIFTYEIGFSMSAGPLVWVYNADILNSEKALGVATATNWVCGFIIGLVFPSLNKALGIYTMFWIFAGFCILGFLYMFIFVKETFGKTQKEIVSMFITEEQEPLNLTMQENFQE